MGPIRWKEIPPEKVRRPFNDPQSGGLTVGEKIACVFEDVMRQIASKPK